MRSPLIIFIVIVIVIVIVMETFDKQVVTDKRKEEILASAERTLHYTNLLIAQCESWLTAEEGNKIEN